MRGWNRWAGAGASGLLVGVWVMLIAASVAVDEHVLVPERELLAVETAAPDTLVLVLRDGDRSDPPSQDASAYRVNGQAVREVGRHTAPIYEERNVDWSAGRYPMILMHRIYLVLPDLLREGAEYRIEYPGGATAITFDSRTVRSESLKVNQVGYSPRGESPRAFFSAWLGDLGGRPLEGPQRFHVHDAETDRAVLERPIRPAASDPDAGDPSYVLDLAGLPTPGEYYIVIPGVGRSVVFGHGDRYAFQTFYVHMKGFYHQRCGIALTEPYTRWTRGACHTTMRITDAEPPGFIREPGGREVPSIGGHHDAGDFDHRLSHTLVAGWLLNAYELSPDKFTDGQLNMPESGNTIPDLLDEALFAIMRWESLQAEDGGIHAGTEADRHPTYGEVDAAGDTLDYRTYRGYGHTTLAGAALFAYAARLVEPFDDARAAELRERALRAWRFYERHEANDDYQFSLGAILFASGQLYLLTGDANYHGRFLEQARLLLDGQSSWPAQYHATFFNIPTVDGGMVFTHYFISYLLDDTREKDAAVAEAFRAAIIRKADEAVHTLETRDWAYWSTDGWGRSTGVGRWGDFLVHAHHLTGEQRYLDAASRAADFALGANPAGWCFTTGLGHRPPYNPLQLDAYMHIQNGLGPTPGLVIYGVADVPQAPYVKVVIEQVHPSIDAGELPRLRAITDGWSVVQQNEFTTCETMAPNTFLHAYLAPAGDWQGAPMPYGEPRLPGGYPIGRGEE